MDRSHARSRARRWLTGASALAIIGGLIAIPASRVTAAEPSDMVLDWNANAVAILSTPGTATPPGLGQGPPLSAVHLAMVQGAVYDAVNAIDPTNAPYLGGVSGPATASKAAAVAQAAHDVLAGLIPATAPLVLERVDAMLTASLLEVPDGTAETAGRTVGAAAATAMLAARAGDGRPGTGTWATGSGIGEWRPVPPANASVFALFGDVTPFLMLSSDQFRTKGPLDVSSRRYAMEFAEVKAKGAKTGSTRTDDETSLAGFVAANPLPYMNLGMREIALARGLTPNEQARLFAMTTLSAADALIGCWDDKAHWSFWRPQTAIVEAGNDGNPWTEPDPAWESLYPNPGYPDHPSGYNCYTGATWHSARLFFKNDKMAFSLTSPGSAPIPGSTRTYHRFTEVIDDTIDGRIYTGFHFRTPDVQGALLGEHVAEWAAKHAFGPAD